MMTIQRFLEVAPSRDLYPQAPQGRGLSLSPSPTPTWQMITTRVTSVARVAPMQSVSLSVMSPPAPVQVASLEFLEMGVLIPSMAASGHLRAALLPMGPAVPQTTPASAMSVCRVAAATPSVPWVSDAFQDMKMDTIKKSASRFVSTMLTVLLVNTARRMSVARGAGATPTVPSDRSVSCTSFSFYFLLRSALTGLLVVRGNARRDATSTMTVPLSR